METQFSMHRLLQKLNDIRVYEARITISAHGACSKDLLSLLGIIIVNANHLLIIPYISGNCNCSGKCLTSISLLIFFTLHDIFYPNFYLYPLSLGPKVHFKFHKFFMESMFLLQTFNFVCIPSQHLHILFSVLVYLSTSYLWNL